MLLLKIKENPPEEWNVYYNGWDFTRNVSSSGVGIHHPVPGGESKRSFKRISTYTTRLSPVKNTCITFDDGDKCGLTYGFWSVQWSATESGHSVTAPGSSGSPLFNSKKRIIGTLTGGSSSCNSGDANNPDFYARFDRQWDNYPNPENRLKPWLDPLGISQGTLDGYPSSVEIDQIDHSERALGWYKFDGAAIFTWQGKDGVSADAFSTSGKLIGTKTFYTGENRWALPAGAVYLIRVEGEIVKIQL
jgi:hypothetical protein